MIKMQAIVLNGSHLLSSGQLFLHSRAFFINEKAIAPIEFLFSNNLLLLAKKKL